MRLLKYTRYAFLLFSGKAWKSKKHTSTIINYLKGFIQENSSGENGFPIEFFENLLAIAYHKMFMLTDELHWLDKSTEIYSEIYDWIAFEDSKIVWQHCLTGLSSNLVKMAALSDNANERDNQLERACSVNNELMARSANLSQKQLLDAYENRSFILSQQARFEDIADLYHDIRNDPRLKLSALRDCELFLESTAMLTNAQAFSASPELMNKLIGLHNEAKAIKFQNFSRSSAIKLIKMHANNCDMMYHLTGDEAYLVAGERALLQAIKLSTSFPKFPLTRVMECKLTLFKGQIFLASQRSDEQSINKVISAVTALRSELPLGIEPSASDKCKGVLAYAHLVRSQLRGGSLLDISDAASLILSVEQDGGELDTRIEDSVNKLFNEQRSQFLGNHSPTKTERENIVYLTNRFRARLKTNPDDVIKLFTSIADKHIFADHSNNLELKRAISEEFISKAVPIFESVSSPLGDSMSGKKASVRKVSEGFQQRFFGIEKYIRDDLKYILRDFDDDDFLPKYNGWRNSSQDAQIDEILAKSLAPECVIKLCHYINFSFNDSDAKQFGVLRAMPSAAFIYRALFKNYMVDRFDEAGSKNASSEVSFEIAKDFEKHLKRYEGTLANHVKYDLYAIHSIHLIKYGTHKKNLKSIQSALLKITIGLSMIDRQHDFEGWLRNRQVYIKGLRALELIKESEPQFDWRPIIRNIQQTLEHISFERNPFAWCIWQSDLCQIKSRSLRSSGPSSMLEALCDEFEQYLENVHLLIRSSSSLLQKREHIDKASSVGDLLALHYLELNAPSLAIAAVDKVRGIRLSSSLLETSIPIEFREGVRQKRLEWEALTSDLESSSFQLISKLQGSATGITPATNDSAKLAAEAFAIYQDALESAGQQADLRVDTSLILSILPSDALLCIPVMTNLQCKMILVGRDRSGREIVHSLPLGGTKQSDFAALLKGNDAWLDRYESFRDVPDGDNDALNLKFDACEETLYRASKTLGSALIQPLIDWLLGEGLHDHIRELMFVPDGALSMLPIQAAQYFVSPSAEQSEYLIERFAVSLWPTVSSVVHYLSKAQSVSSEASALIVDSINSEASNVPNYLLDAVDIPTTIFRGVRKSDFDPKDVLKSLSSHRIAYLYCHGIWDNDDPELSGLELVDGESGPPYRLCVKDVRQEPLSHTQLAFLGACESAMIGVNILPNEFVGLPAAFMEAGVRGVVSTLWAVHQDCCTQVANAFFKEHLERGVRPAIALQKAILAVSSIDLSDQEAEFNELMFWASFVMWGN